MSVSLRGSERANAGRTSKRFAKRTLQGRVALAAAVSLTASGMWSACAEAARGKNDIKGAQVLAGAAQISHKGNTTTIRPIDKTIIRYDRFNVPKNGTVRFVQPSSSSRVLNRIDSAAPSRIDGRFTANGIVFFVNPAGVMFGPTAVVDVGQLYAGAGSIGDQDFLGGINKFSTARGSVVNQGKISGEQVHLFGSQVVNRGSIVADGGIVTMSSGKDVFIGEEGGNILVKVEGPASGKSGVVNSGTVNAGKGAARMMSAGDIYSVAVNTSGMVKAKDVAIDAGKGAALVSGKIDASDTSAGGVGGKVTITGGKVGLVGASVDASGTAGGGTVLVGGDVHGGGTTPTATATLVNSTSTIKADAIESGNGGKVVVWSDKVTVFRGDISAKGGATSGNGGFVEVSGKKHLVFEGDVTVTAANGTAGTLLLDPASITIVEDPNDRDLNGDGIHGPDLPPPLHDDLALLTDLDQTTDQAGANSVISNDKVDSLLNGGNILVLAATNFISVNAPVTGSGDASLTLDTPTVNLNSTITLTGGGVLGGVGVNTVNVFNGGSIQNGVDIVANAGTVNVGAGPYGGFTVNKSISLLGANNTKTGFDGTRGAESVINGQVVLNAPNTTFKGFTVNGVTTGAGVVVSNGQGDLIANNIITDNVFGMSLASDGSSALTVQGNLFDTNDQSGSASKNGIYTDFTVSNVVVNNNHFTGNTEGSVSFFGSAGNPQSSIEISDNVMTDDGPIGLETVTNVNITRNTINNSTAHAIWIAGGVSNVTISNNFLENNDGAGVKFAAQNIDATPASNVTITDNSIQNNADGGIVITAGRYSGTLDATSNYWGSDNGPTDAGTLTDHGNTYNVGLGSQGNAIVNPGGTVVNYVKWLTGGADTAPGTAGFQPDAGSLFAPVKLIHTGDPDQFFANIQNALSAAVDGDSIELASGTYTEVSLSTAASAADVTMNFLAGGGEIKGGTITLGDAMTIQENAGGNVVISDNVAAGSHNFTVNTNSLLAAITMTGAINGSGTITLDGQDSVSIGGAIGAVTAPANLNVSALTNVLLSSAISATNVSIGAGGTVTQSGGSLAATTLGVDSTGGVSLGQANSVGTAAIETTNSDVLFRTSGPMAIGSVGSLNGISAGSGTVRLVSGAGITQSQTISANTLGVNAAGTVALNLANPTVNFAGSNSNGGSGISYVSNGGLTLVSVGASGAFGATSGASTNNGDVLLKGAGTVNINQPISAGNATVRLVSTGGDVAQNASGGISAGSLGVRATGNVTLNVASNDVDTVAALSSVGSNSVSFSDTDDLIIESVPADGAVIFSATSGVTAGGPASVTASGGVLAVNANVSGNAITLEGTGVTQNGSSSVDAGAGLISVDGNAAPINMTGTLTTTNATASAVQILGGTSVALPTVSAANGGFSVNGAASNVSQNPGETITAGSIVVNSASGTVTLGNNNSIGTVLTVSSLGGLTINDVSGGLILSGPFLNGAADPISITTAGGPLAIQADITGGAVVLGGAGMTEASIFRIIATTLRLNSLGTATLTNLNNVGTLAASAGDLSFTNNAALIIGSASGLNGVNIGGNTLNISANGAITQTQPVTAGISTFTSTLAGAPINLNSTTNSISGAITFAPTGAGNVTLFNNTATNLAGSTVGGNLSVTSTGAITDSGTLAVAGSATFETRSNGSANITLDQPLSAFGSITARSRDAANSANGSSNISIVESGTMDVTAIASGSGAITLEAAKINLGGADTVESSGAITLQPTLQAAAIDLGTNLLGVFSFSATDLAALKDGFSSITIGQSNGGGAVTVSSNVTFRDPVSITGGSFVGGATLATNGANNMTLHATAGGVGTAITPLDVLVGGTLSVTADGANAAGDIFITSGGALALGGNITTDAATAQTVNVTANGITITSSNGGSSNDNLVLRSTAAFTVNNVTLSGNTISITATNDINDSGTGVIATSGAGGLTLISNVGGIGVNGNALGVSVGGTGLLSLTTGGANAAGNVSITSGNSLTLGAVTTSGTAQTVDVRTTSGNLRLNNSVTGIDNWVLNAAGTLNNNGTTLTAASVDADGAGGIGTSGSFSVATTSLSADSSGGLVSVLNSSAAPVTIASLSAGGTGDVNYSQSGGGSASFGGATTADGSINLVNVGGAIALNGTTSAGGSGDVAVSTAIAGDVTVNSPVSGVNVTLDSAGNLITNATVTASDGAVLAAVNDVTLNGAVSGVTVAVSSGGNTTANANVTASGTAGIISGGNITGTGTVGGATLNLIAVTGIGTIGTPLNVTAGTLTASTSGGGAASIILHNSSGGTMTLSDVSTVGAGANITVSQSGAGNRLRLVNVSATAGDVMLSTAETINEALNDDSGAHTAEITAVNATLIGNNGIGTTSRLDLAVSGTVTVNTIGGDANIADNAGLTLGASSVGGDLTAVAETGNFLTTGPVSIGDTGVLTAQAGGATMTIGDTLSGGTGNLTLTADGGITLASTVDGGNAFTATANSGNIVALADIGATTPPTSVNFSGINITLQNVETGSGNQAYNASGLITLNGSDYRSNGGSISFNGNAALTAPVITVTSGGGSGDDISFSGTANGATALTLAAGAGNVSIGGAAGGGLISLDATGEDITLHDVTTSGVQLYTGAGTITLQGAYTAGSGAITFDGDATLASAVTVDAGGGTDSDDIVFTGTITGPGSLTATAATLGDVTLGGAGGVGTPLGFATIAGNDITLNGMVSAGAQSYTASGIITLGGTYSAASGAITFAAGTTTLSAASSVTTNGGTDADDISFTGNINGAFALTLTANGAGDVVIGGDVGIAAISATANDIGVKNVTTSGAQTYTASGTITLGGATYTSGGDDIIFAGDALLTSNTTVSTTGGNDITFAGTVDGPHTLTVNTTSGNGITTFGDVVGGTTPLTSITTDADGTLRINGTTSTAISTSGDQIYNDAVTLGINATLNGTNITFASTVDSSGGARDLTVNASAATTFGGAVGGISALRNLVTDAAGNTVIGGGAISTTEDQTFNDAVTLGANTTLSGNNITFASTLNGAQTLTVITAGSGITTFGGAVGGSTPLLSLTTNADGTTRINGGVVTTVTDQTYNDAVTLGADATLSGNDIAFASTVDGAVALTINSAASGVTSFGEEVGGGTPLLSLTTNADGTTQINGGIVTTSGDQSYGDAVTIGANTTLTGNDITFASTLDGAQTLTIDTSGSGITTFGGAVGATTALAGLTTNADGTTNINGGSVASSGAQAYNDAVLLGADTTISGGSVSFATTVNSSGAPRDLTVNSSGATVFGGAVGGAATGELKNLVTDTLGTTAIDGGSVKTTQNQTYNDVVTIGADATLTGVNIAFGSTLDGAHVLSVIGSGDTTFGGPVGAAAALTSLTTDGPGTTKINGGSVQTTGIQLYGDDVVLGADTSLSGTNLTFSKTVNSDATARDLLVNSSGTGVTTFAAAVGGTSALKNLITNADGTTRIINTLATTTVTTTEDQNYKDDVDLGADATLSGVDITFEKTIDSDAASSLRALTVNGSGVTTFGGAVGSATSLKSLTTDAAGATHINGGAVVTSADQTYNDAVTLGANTGLKAANTTFALTVDSDLLATPRNLNIDGTGVARFDGAVGENVALNNLTTEAGGSTRINGGEVTTLLNQLYKNATVVGNNTVFTGTGVSFSSTLNSDAVGTARDVTVDATTTTFAGAVGLVAPLKNLVTNAAGTTNINAASVTTTEDQTYNDAVTLGNNSTLSGNDITFGSTINGARSLTVNSTDIGPDIGTTTFVGAIGGTTALVSLTTDADGATRIGGTSVRTTGAQSFGDAVTITADTTFTGGNMSFGDTIDSDAALTNRKLTMTSTGDIDITGAVGGTFAISSAVMTAKNIDIHSVHSAGDQTYTATTLATINGNYISDGGLFKITGNTSLGGGASVSTNGTGTGGESHDITFTGTIDGNHTLNLTATGLADVIVQKAIGAGSAVGGFTAAAQTIDVVSIKARRTGPDADHLGVISLKVDPSTTIDGRFDQDADGGAATAFKPTGTIKIAGNLESNGGDIVLGTTSARSDTNVVAFPTIIIRPPALGTATISGRNITMGRNEKLVVDGSVNISATGQATLSDITASDNIAVSATTIVILQRNAGTVIASDGETLLNDVNTDFVARNAINFNGDVEVEGTIDQNRRVLFATAGNDVSGTPAGTSVRALNPDTFSINLANGSELIDLRAEGPSVTNPAAALAGAAPQESRQPEVENAVASSQAALLTKLGIFARDMDRNSLIAFLEGFTLYNDVPQGIASGAVVPREKYQVTKNRLSFEGAQRVLDLYYVAFYQTDENGRAIKKNGEYVDNTPAIEKAIGDAVIGYREKSGRTTGNIDGAAFREYVETTPSQKEALKYMNRLRNLFDEILPVGETGSRKGIGLTPWEAQISRKVLLGSLNVEGMGIDLEELEKAILAKSSRPGSLARPQAKPAANPAARPVAKPVVNPAPKPVK